MANRHVAALICLVFFRTLLWLLPPRRVNSRSACVVPSAEVNRRVAHICGCLHRGQSTCGAPLWLPPPRPIDVWSASLTRQMASRLFFSTFSSIETEKGSRRKRWWICIWLKCDCRVSHPSVLLFSTNLPGQPEEGEGLPILSYVDQ